jgi:SAM-dependent methyltransferase
MSTTCPLCKNTGPFQQFTDRLKRTLNKCDRCYLVFVESRYLPEQDEEKSTYEQHKNSIEDVGYVQFLMQAIDPALKFLSKNAKGLDYGCGPGPTLSQLMERKGYSCQNYDPLFLPELPAGPFDFVFATECFEHFFDPAKEMEQLILLLKSQAYLIVMTSLWENNTNFADWTYTQDNTHVSFFHERTIGFIANKYGFGIVFNDLKRIIILKKR